MADGLCDRVVLPVANEEDARASADAIRPYSEAVEGTIVAVYVIEKAGGAPDKAPVELSEEVGEETLAALRDALAGVDLEIETRIVYGTDVAETILETASEEDASAIVFTPRGGSQWVKLLTGDVTTELLAESHLPVVVLPDDDGGPEHS